MNLPRTLSRSPRPLSAVLADAAARQTSALSRLRGIGGQQTPDDLQLPLPLDEYDDHDQAQPQRFVRPDEVAAAALLGRALDDHRGVLANLLKSDAVTVIQVPTAEFVESIGRILRRHVIGVDGVVFDGDGLALSDMSIADPGSVVVFARDGNTKAKLAAAGNAEFSSAVQRRFAVIGVAADPERTLPRELVRMAEHRIVLPPLDVDTIATVIEAITGRHPGPLDPELGRHAALLDLMVAVRADLGPARCVERLRRIQADRSDPSTPLLSNLRGLGEARDWGLNLVRDLQAYMAGALPWSAVDRGVLLSSPPGCGKTMFARSLAKTAGVHFVATSYSEWQSSKDGHLGSVTACMRATFAVSTRPAIVFVDEIDSIPARGRGRYDDWWTAIVNTLLELLDGFSQREGVVVIAACNHPDRLDPALVRSGRLDKHIRIPLPDTPALAGILRAHLGDDLKNVDLLPAAIAARGGSGADVERWVRVSRRSARNAERALTLDDLMAAIREGGTELPAQVRRRTAYHEAGHALASMTLEIAHPVSLSIQDSGGGLTQTKSAGPTAQTRAYIEKYVVCGLAGRAAEEIVFGDVTAGAGGDERSDLSRVTRLALQMEASFGLGEFGLLWVGDEPTVRDLLIFADLRQTVTNTLETAYIRAKQLLTENRAALDCLAEALCARGFLDRADIDAIMAKTRLNSPRSVPTTMEIAVPALDKEESGAIDDGPGLADLTPQGADHA